jgi:hypothetical protein
MVGVTASLHWVIPVRTILTGFGVFLLGSLSDLWHQHYGGGLLVASIDDALIGVGAGLLVLLVASVSETRILP